MDLKVSIYIFNAKMYNINNILANFLADYCYEYNTFSQIMDTI